MRSSNEFPSLSKLSSSRMILIISLSLSVIMVYPNTVDFTWHFPESATNSEQISYGLFFFFRYLFFYLLIWILLTVSIQKQKTLAFFKRLINSFWITFIAYTIYVIFSLAISKHVDCFTGILLFQFVITCLFCTFIGYFFTLYAESNNKEKQIEKLKAENLQSLCNALVNQINPHFFFNSLNSVSALVREDEKEKTLEYINKLSGVFRYILQRDKIGLTFLNEELNFLEAFRYTLEVRYENKLKFHIHIDDEKRNLKLPVLSLLPVVENVVKHNIIDSYNPMEITLSTNANDELVIVNPIHEKLDAGESSGIGLENLSKRFELLTGKNIRIEKNNGCFMVYLPLFN
ncbi:histidine kinase [uncultured Bacteroides sp.]|uniref:sensor histidine kinase n=1 Tax=uncultured Bacteroides sp. TaxID=162156 RepID=UPI002AA84CBF|nr:histidine kinase [uncultured Bacteroides sp.]